MDFKEYKKFCKKLDSNKFYLVYFEDKCFWHIIAKIIQSAEKLKYIKIAKKDKRFKKYFIPNHVAYLCKVNNSLKTFDSNLIAESRLDGFYTKTLFNVVRKYKGRIFLEEFDIPANYKDINNFIDNNRGKPYSIFGAFMSWFDLTKSKSKKLKGGFCSMMTCIQCKRLNITLNIESGKCSEISPCDMLYCKKTYKGKTIKTKIIKLK